jgi:hypothetical protein
MELPTDRYGSQSSLINVYRQYEKRLGVASKFAPKKRDDDYEDPVAMLRGFHFIYLLLLACWFLVQSVVLFTGTPVTFTERVLDTLLYISHGKLPECF